ncbi:hypothetical protein COO60DRAFT_92114 [Scenedesmus sp. NREL 46B-D3]|nr:hypothetical protein COO60DRAFT_92114 [Scenedesmus sp. NREL 46B-D3]
MRADAAYTLRFASLVMLFCVCEAGVSKYDRGEWQALLYIIKGSVMDGGVHHSEGVGAAACRARWCVDSSSPTAAFAALLCYRKGVGGVHFWGFIMSLSRTCTTSPSVA